MGLGETQVFQDEKSRLANTTVARIVAAKGSLNDPETKKECCRKLQKLNATLKDRVAAVDAAMARDAMKGGVTGLGCDNRTSPRTRCKATFRVPSRRLSVRMELDQEVTCASAPRTRAKR